VLSVLKRIVHPGHLFHALSLQRKRKTNKRAYDDAQLAFLSEILPGGFLHYGYFDDPDRLPDDISLNELLTAQRRYAELLMECVHDRSAPVLDVGCGMGALSELLVERGYEAVALTPDRLQARHIETEYPGIPIIRSKFEDLPQPANHAGRYGTIVTSESLQYLDLDRALPLLEQILKPGGRWIACDYFRRGNGESGGDKSGHDWNHFRERIARDGWVITLERDITGHILPTLRYMHMWGARFGVPLLKFILLKLRVKQPAVHYILHDVFRMLDGTIEDNLELIDPDTFARTKRYMLLVMQRRD
jgi:cyclopropane fatty-acyl-phospholipid synthase-like methyltransferase